jgi:folate-binding protein YgfZ
MNQNWKSFLLSRQASFDGNDRVVFPSTQPETPNRIYPVTHLAVLTVAGKDAAQLLQGQMTCNVNDVNENLSSLGAFCNPKGRAIATFLLVKTHPAFLLVLPAELLQTVKERLQKYVLRSDVTINDGSDEFCIIGISQADARTGPLFFTRQDDVISVNFSSTGHRYLVIAPAEKAIGFWSDRVNRLGFQPDDSDRWRHLELLSGIPWLSAATSEEFIPQMLNIDKLGGISFNKGCYTGQEIVARTHFLGQAKREMFLAEAHTLTAPEANTTIIDGNSNIGSVVGKVVSAYQQDSICTLLVVLQIPANRFDNLRLTGPNQNKITLL